MKTCKNCVEYKNCRDSVSSWIFFIIGIIATIAIRIVIVLMPVYPVYGKLAWYIGVGGFFLFFLYKFKVSNNRAELIKRSDLVGKIRDKKELSHEDYSLINGILCSLSSKKERINFFFIFGLSALALIIALYIDFLR
ncbi:hypothetical protein KJ633_04120 [bacterium]|nr:hypothetical protein [bacterium]MBU3955625.1 hypothetical protein [bacterium]